MGEISTTKEHLRIGGQLLQAGVIFVVTVATVSVKCISRLEACIDKDISLTSSVSVC